MSELDETIRWFVEFIESTNKAGRSPEERGFYLAEERELHLVVFLSLVREGKTPEPWLLEYIAEGVEAFLHGRKPWPVRQGNKRRNGVLALQAYGLEEIGVPRGRAAKLLGLIGEPRTHLRHIRDGEERMGGLAGESVYRLALARLIQTKPKEMTAEERDKIQTVIDALNMDRNDK